MYCLYASLLAIEPLEAEQYLLATCSADAFSLPKLAARNLKLAPKLVLPEFWPDFEYSLQKFAAC
jgi:hypothetical protein